MLTLIEPVQKHESLLADIAAADPGEGLCAWWLGQSGFYLKSSAGVVLFDPYLSDSLTTKYAETDKPHVRMTALAVRPGELKDVDVVTSTHNHTDHLDAETLGPLLEANPSAALVIPEANREFVANRLGCETNMPVGLTDGEVVEIGNLKVHAVAAAHNELERDEQGRCKFLGYVVELGGMTVYHSGDTLRYPGMAEILSRWSIDLAILPINGNKPERRVAGNLDGAEAAQLAHDIGARLVVPCHFEMFEFNTASPDRFIETCQRLGQECRVLRCGERLEMARKEG